MKGRLNGAVATCALSACVVCHIWAWIVIAKEYTHGGIEGIRCGISFSLVVLYMVSVCLFNWHAVNGQSERYRRMSLVVTAIHLACALLQAAAAESVMVGSGNGGGWIMTYGITLPAVLNLPMNSTEVIWNLSSLLPWGTACFFALNLAVIALRMRREKA